MYIHNISDEIEIRPDRTKDYGVSCPWASGKIPIDLYWDKSCEHSKSFMFDSIILILAGNEDMHEAWMSTDFDQIPPPTPELSALARLKN